MRQAAPHASHAAQHACTASMLNLLAATVPFALVLVQHAVPGDGWRSLFLLKNCSSAAFQDAVAPLAEMTRLTYTSTNGSYYNASDERNSPDGWTRVTTLKHDPQAGGMRALVFVQPSHRRGVVAFRGTDLNSSSPSGQADMCADKMLWDSASWNELPTYCANFSNKTLDYLTSAFHFEARARAAFPTLDFLFTGHSLGAGLAVLVASSLRSRAVVFSAPGLRGVMRNRTHTDPERVTVDHVFVLADVNDPVFQGSRAEIGGEGSVGTSCTWRTMPGPACASCYAPPHPLPNTSRADCESCFARHHIFAHYLALVAAPDRPLCATSYM